MSATNEIELFHYQDREVRTVVINTQPWFVTADVCAVLGISNHRDALSGLDDDEKGVVTVDTPGGQQQVTIISEAGLYSLILRSRKPEAKAFKRWVTHEVLPAIRKTGAYAIPAQRGGEPVDLEVPPSHLMSGLPKPANGVGWLKKNSPSARHAIAEFNAVVTPQPLSTEGIA